MNLVRKKSNRTKLKPFTLDIKDPVGIYSISEFEEVLKYERIRSDRNNSVFSITLFKSPEIYESKNHLDQFLKEIKEHVRQIDHIGWHDDNHIAALLPDTQRSGAVILGKKVLDNIGFLHDAADVFEVYSYPDNWLKKKDEELPNRSSDNNRIIDMDFFFSVETGFTTKMPGWKRSMDIILASVGLLLSLPIFIIIPLYIKLISPGMVFFHQQRVGYKGKEFCFWKFRTMHVDNNESFHGKHSQNFIRDGDVPMEKLDNHDPRIFFGGKVLRKSCIDELPQLWNVLKGDMSLVGPRPCIPYEAEAYLRWHTHRFDVVPGLTGLWQVSGKNKLTFKQMIRLDILYSNNLSFWNDVRIILKTPLAIVEMVGEAALKKILKNRTDGYSDLHLADDSKAG